MMRASSLAALALVVSATLARADDTPAPAKPLIIGAAEIAPADLRADEPVKNKWWLNRNAREWGAPQDTILMTGKPNEDPIPKKTLEEWGVIPAAYYVPYRVPELTIDPKVRGWHRIHVGLYHEPKEVRARLWGKLTGEPYPEYLQTPDSTATRSGEVYWKAADLTGKKIHLSQPPAPMPHPGRGWMGGISHIKLVPMTDKEVEAARRETSLPPPAQRLFGMLDSTDEIFWWGTAESEDDIRGIIYRHQQAGFGRVYWRCFGSHLDTSAEVPEANARWTEADDKNWCKAHHCESGWLPYLNLPRKFDALKVASAYGKEIDVEVHAWVRMTNFNRPPYAEFWHKHPEFRAQILARDGKGGFKRVPYARVLSFAYPEVRAFYVKFFKQLASTGTRGIMIDLLRHPPLAGFEPASAADFKKKYGIDMESLVGKDPQEDPNQPIYHNPKVTEHYSGYLEQFLRELRKEIGNDIEISVRSSGPDKYGLRGRDWVKSGLINTIVDGNWYSGNGPRPTIAATIAAAGDKGRAYAIAEAGDVDPKKGWGKRPGWLSAEAIEALSGHYRDKGARRFGIYESTLFTYYPDVRRAVRQAGWEYGKK